MVLRRVVLAEEGFRECIGGLGLSWGFLIGYEWGDYLAFLAETPELPEEEKDPIAWSLEHAKQVLPLLPGGLTIKGVYHAHDDSSKTNAYPRAHQTLKELSSILSEQQKDFLYLDVDTKDPDSSTLCAVELTLSKVSPSNTSKKFVDLQYQTQIPWTQVKGKFILDFNSFRTSHATDETADFTKHMKKVLNSLKDILKSKAIITFNHEFKSQDETIDNSGNNNQDSNECQVLEAQIMLESDALIGVDDETMVNSTSKLKLGGKVSICAFLRPGATIREACEAVIQDITRSLNIRFQIHSDTLEVDDKNISTEIEGPIIYEPPRRVLVPVPSTNNIFISDYLFSGETSYDSTVSVKELFGFTPVPDEIDDEVELIISPNEIKNAEEDEEESVNGIGANSNSGGVGLFQKYPRTPYNYYAMAFGILLLAVFVFFIQGTQKK